MLSDEFIIQLCAKIEKLIDSGQITGKKYKVLKLLLDNWEVRPVTQGELVLAIEDGCSGTQTTASLNTKTRRLRHIIRDLRVKHGIPVLHDYKGHFLPKSKVDAEKFVQQLEKDARRHSLSSLQTYRILKNEVGVESSILERLENLFDSSQEEND